MRDRGGLVERSPLVLGVVSSIPAHVMWALWWTNTVCVGFLGVLPFPPTFFIPPIHPIISIWPEPKLPKSLKIQFNSTLINDRSMNVTWLLVFALLGQENNNKRECGENEKNMCVTHVL